MLDDGEIEKFINDNKNVNTSKKKQQPRLTGSCVLWEASVDSQPTIDRLSVDLLTDSRPTIDRKSVERRSFDY